MLYEYLIIFISDISKFFAMSLGEMIVFLTASDHISYTGIGLLVVFCLGGIINLLRGL